MYEDAAAEHPESQADGKGKEDNANVTPQRCKDCDDLDYCDTDFCIHWWH